MAVRNTEAEVHTVSTEPPSRVRSLSGSVQWGRPVEASPGRPSTSDEQARALPRLPPRRPAEAVYRLGSPADYLVLDAG